MAYDCGVCKVQNLWGRPRLEVLERADACSLKAEFILFYFILLYFTLFYFPHSCAGPSLLGSGFSLVSVLGLLPLQSLSSRPLGFQRLRLVGLSCPMACGSRDQTHVPCIGRRLLTTDHQGSPRQNSLTCYQGLSAESEVPPARPACIIKNDLLYLRPSGLQLLCPENGSGVTAQSFHV